MATEQRCAERGAVFDPETCDPLVSLTGKRATMRRGAYLTRKSATAALTRILECERAGIWLDDRQTVTDYLTTWLAEKSRTLTPTTAAV